MPENEKSQISNFQTDQLIDQLDLQDRELVQLVRSAEGARKRNRQIRAHIAAHGREIDFSRVLAGR